MNNNLEWLNLNSQRNYPIREDANRTDVTGNFILPNDIIVDAVFVTTVDASFFIKKINLFDEIVTITIHDTSDVFVTLLSINVPTHNENDSYIVTGNGIYNKLQGKIVIGNLSRLTRNVIGSYTFDSTATVFEHTVIIPSIRGVDSIIVNEESVLVNDVKFAAGFNVRLRVDETLNCIFIDAIEGEGLGPFCECEDDTPVGDPLLTINSINPDASGNFNFRGVGCIEVQEVQGGIEIENTCQETCCDCEIGDDLDELAVTQAQITNRIADLSSRVEALENP